MPFIQSDLDALDTARKQGRASGFRIVNSSSIPSTITSSSGI
jgi:hypothetical protein